MTRASNPAPKPEATRATALSTGTFRTGSLHHFSTFLLIGIPLMLVAFLLGNLLDFADEVRRTAAREALEARLDGFASLMEPESFFQNIFDTFAERINASGAISPENLAKEWRAIASGGTSFEAYFFDSNGSLVPVAGIPTRETVLVQTAWHFLREILNKEDGPRWPKLMNLFGMDLDFNRLRKFEGRTMWIEGSTGNGLIYWRKGNSGPKSGFLAILWDAPPAEVILQHLIRRGSFEDAILEVTDVSGKPIFRSREGRNLEENRSRLSDVTASRRVESLSLSGAAAWEPLDPLKKIAGIGVLVSLLGIATAFFFSLSFSEGETRFVPIRLKLLGLLAYIAGVSSLGLVVLGLRHLHDRTEVEKRTALLAGQDALGRFDSAFHEAKRRSLAFFRGIRDDPRMRENPAEMLNEMEAAEKNRLLNWLEARDTDARILFTIEREETTKQIGILGIVLTKLIMESYLQERMKSGPAAPPKAAEVMAQSIIESPILGWGTIMAKPDTIHEIRFGRFDLFWYWDVFRDPNHPAALVQGNQRVHDLAEKYLKAALPAILPVGDGAMKAWAVHEKFWETWPRKMELPPPLKELLSRTRRAREFSHAVVSLDGEKFLAMAISGKLLKRYLLVGIYPFSRITRPVAGIQRILLGGMALMVVFVLLLGWVLAETFLRPVRVLSQGVLALKKRDTSVRIPFTTADELGDLAMTFNRTLEDVQELMFASKIQALLGPGEFTVPLGYEIDCGILVATDLGGDYADIVPLPDKSLLLIVGDVTGHGVSSALVMAMAKAAVFKYTREMVPITDLMAGMNRLLCRLLHRKKLMTLGALRLEPAIGVVSFSNAGHPLPALVDREGKVSRPEINRAPLGFSERAPFEHRDFPLEPGNMLAIYSDGILETRAPSGEPYGFPRFGEFLSRRRTKPLPDIRRELVDELDSFSGHLPREDDITLILLRRSENPETAEQPPKPVPVAQPGPVQVGSN